MFTTCAKFAVGAAVLMVLVIAFQADAEVEWKIENTLKTGQPPIDVAVSPDGKSVFVLTEDGSIAVYDRRGRPEGTIEVGAHIDQIRIGPSGEKLFATSRRNQTVEIIALDFIRKINVSGSPSKGPGDARVIVAVFSDFQ